MPRFPTYGDFDAVFPGKQRGQCGCRGFRRAINTDAIIRSVTAALSTAHEDKGYEVELRVRISCSMREVGVPVASAVLALVFLERYGIIDFRGWRQLFGGSRRALYPERYQRYLLELRWLAEELGQPVQ